MGPLPFGRGSNNQSHRSVTHQSNGGAQFPRQVGLGGRDAPLAGCCAGALNWPGHGDHGQPPCGVVHSSDPALSPPKHLAPLSRTATLGFHSIRTLSRCWPLTRSTVCYGRKSTEPHPEGLPYPGRFCRWGFDQALSGPIGPETPHGYRDGRAKPTTGFALSSPPRQDCTTFDNREDWTSFFRQTSVDFRDSGRQADSDGRYFESACFKRLGVFGANSTSI